MRLLEIFSQLTETTSDIVYHLTNLGSLADIIDSNKFRLPLSSSTSAEVAMGVHKLFYMSLARNPSSGYISDKGEGNVILKNQPLLVLDGAKLSQRYKIVPVEYWGVKNGRQGSGPNSRGKEQEDRLFSDQQFIPDAISYIKEIRIILDPKIDERESSRLRKLYLALSKTNIAVKWYCNVDDYEYGGIFSPDYEQTKAKKRKEQSEVVQSFLRGSDKNQINPAQYFKQLNKEKPSTYDGGAWDKAEKLKAKRGMIEPSDQRLRDEDYYKELFYKNSLEALSPKARSKLYYLTGYNPTDSIRSLEAAVQNARSPHHRGGTEFQAEIAKMYKATKTNTPKELCTYFINKWTKIRNDSQTR